MSAQLKYGREIQAWLGQHFPEFGAHPAAVSAVIRLHFVVGKGRLTVEEHGEQIRRAVAAWNQRWELV